MTEINATLVTDEEISASFQIEKQSNPNLGDLGEYVDSIISAKGSISWITLSADTSLSVNSAYAVDSQSLMVLDLPPGNTNDRLILYAYSSALFRLQQPRNTDFIQIGDKRTTQGVTGAIVATAIGDCIELRKVGDRWLGNILQGNFNVL